MADLFDPRHERVVNGFTIEKGIPKAADKQREKRPQWAKLDIPLADMQVGDSIRVDPQPGQPLIVCQNQVSGAAALYRANKAPEKKFSTRQLQGTHVRIWRDA